MTAPAATVSVAAPPGAPMATVWFRRRIETWPGVNWFAQTLVGKLFLLALFVGLMAALKLPAWKAQAFVLALLTFLPQLRKPILIAAAMAWAFYFSPPMLHSAEEQAKVLTFLENKHRAGTALHYWQFMVAAVLVFGYAYIWGARRFPKSLLGRRPITCLLAIVLLAMAAQAPLNGKLWAAAALFAMILSQYLWFFSYTLSEPRQAGVYPRIKPEYWRYFWATNRVPIGKGASYLDRIEVKDATELATVQIKAVKLLFWAFALTVLHIFYQRILFGRNAEVETEIPYWKPPGLIPTYTMALNAHMAGTPYAWSVRWLALISQFIENIMMISIFGHKLIAVCRMAGFNAFRMTYRPLYSTSISEFFNRIHWYLKEMLATFFFFPTYLRYFKKHPRLRVFFATMAAAGLGNFTYHFLVYDRHIYEMGLWGALKTYHHYAFYCLILGIAIGISQMRIIGKKKESLTGWQKARAITGVLLFYCLLTNFDNETRRDLTLLDYGSYFVSLFTPWR